MSDSVMSDDDDVFQQISEANQRHLAILPFLENATPFNQSRFDPYEETILDLSSQAVLVVGAGALGCDALKCLVMSGYSDITIVDMDTIELSNLNRQFMFRLPDVGQYKAEVAAKFIKTRRPHVDVKTYTDRIQERGKRWLRNFTVIVLCLDNMEARLWINEALHDVVEFKPYFIDVTLQQNGQNDGNNDNNNMKLSERLTKSTLPSSAVDKKNFVSCDTNLTVMDSAFYDPRSTHTITPATAVKGVFGEPIEQSLFNLLGFSASLQKITNLILEKSHPSSSPSLKSPTDNFEIILTTPTIKDPFSAVPFYEGGTEGWGGHYRSLHPFTTYCLACVHNAKTVTQKKDALHAHLCTIASVPRIPEHCIMYAHQLLWPKVISFTSRYVYEMNTHDDNIDVDSISPTDLTNLGIEFDSDNLDHINWCLDRAVERAKQFNITLPTYAQTLGVIKHTIPAISSTNALIASLCIHNAFKFDSGAVNPFQTGDLIQTKNKNDPDYVGYHCSFANDTYTTGIGLPTTQITRNSDCTVCKPRLRLCVTNNTIVLLPLLSIIMKYWYQNNNVNVIYESLSFELRYNYANNPIDESVIYCKVANEYIFNQDYVNNNGDIKSNSNSNKENPLGIPNMIQKLFLPCKDVFTPLIQNDKKTVLKLFTLVDLNPNTSFPSIKFEVQCFE